MTYLLSLVIVVVAAIVLAVALLSVATVATRLRSEITDTRRTWQAGFGRLTARSAALRMQLRTRVRRDRTA